MAIIENSIQYVLDNEGGYNDLPGDEPTNYGIKQSTLARWRCRPVTKDDVKNLTRAEAVRIYTAWYWNTISLGGLKNQNVATAIFDVGVNRGIVIAAKYAQRTVNKYGPQINVDGMLGPISIQALNLQLPNLFIYEFNKLVVEGYNEIVERKPHKRVNLAGWLKRADRMHELLEANVAVN